MKLPLQLFPIGILIWLSLGGCGPGLYPLVGTSGGGGPSEVIHGALDLTFNGTGIVVGLETVPSSVGSAWLYGTIGPRGFLLSYSALTVGPVSQQIAIVKYRPDGTLDSSFNSIGISSADIQPGLSGDAPLQPAFFPDGKVLAVGFGGGSLSFARFNTDGTLDTSFDTDGKATLAHGGSSWGGNGFSIVDSLGRAMLVGHVNSDGFLSRLTSAGAADTGFDGDGIVALDLFGAGRYEAFTALDFQSDGKLIVVGSHSSAVSEEAVVARFLTNGALDASFATGGVLTFDVSGGPDAISCVTIQSDGKIVVGGSTKTMAATTYDLLFARINTNGTFDSTYAAGGRLILVPNFSNAGVSSMAIGSNNSLLVAAAGNGQHALVRLLSDGSTDPTFGTDGAKLTPEMYGSGTVAFDSDGKILTIGYDSNGNPLLSRHLP